MNSAKKQVILALVFILSFGLYLASSDDLRTQELMCFCGNSDSCIAVGKKYENDQSKVPHDREKAISYYEKACNFSNPVGCAALSEFYLDGDIEQFNNKELSLKYSIRACMLKDFSSCNEVAKSTNFNKNSETGAIIVPLLEEGCSFGDRESCYIFANNLDRTQKSLKISLYKKSCELDFAKACFSLASMFIGEKHNSTSFKKSISLFTKGCQLGSADSCLYAGMLRQVDEQNSQNTEKNTEQLRLLYKKGCDYNSAASCTRLALLYDTKELTMSDEQLSFKYKKQACKLGDTFACGLLGEAYEKAIGTQKDLESALIYYFISCRNNNVFACKAIERLR